MSGLSTNVFGDYAERLREVPFEQRTVVEGFMDRELKYPSPDRNPEKVSWRVSLINLLSSCSVAAFSSSNSGMLCAYTDEFIVKNGSAINSFEIRNM